MNKPTKAQHARGSAECDRWNVQHSIGADVTLERDNGSVQTTKTRSEAFVNNNGLAVIFLEGVSGYYLLNRVKPRQVDATCPTCKSPRPTQHPSAPDGVILCRDSWHRPSAAQIESMQSTEEVVHAMQDAGFTWDPAHGHPRWTHFEFDITCLRELFMDEAQWLACLQKGILDSISKRSRQQSAKAS